MKNINKINEFMLKKRMSIIVDPADVSVSNPVDPKIVFGALANLDTWSFYPDDNLVKELLKVSEETFVNKYYNPLIIELKKLKGDDVSHDHFVFQNFPDSCKEIPLEALSEMRFMRYYTVVIDDIFGTDFTSMIMDGKKPEYVERPENENIEKTKIGLATIEDFYKLNKNLIGSKAALSELDREIVDFSMNDKEIPKKEIIPNEIPYKETLALMLKYDMEKHLHLNIEFNSYKDFKRAISVLSDQDAANKNPKLRKFTQKEKRYLIYKLEKAIEKNPDIVLNDMNSDRRFVKNLAKYWRMDALKETAPNACKMFRKISEGKDINAIGTIRGEAIKNKDAMLLINKGFQSPGELFRNLYFLLDNAKNTQETDLILKTAKKVANRVPVDILMNTRSTIMNSNDPNLIKTIFPHGNTRLAYQYETKRGMLDEAIRDEVDKICVNGIISQLSKKLDYENVKIYISEDMKDCPMPFGFKDESGGTRTLTKGTKCKIDGLKDKPDLEEQVLGFKKEENEYIRLFVYKKIPQGGFVDLSVSFLDSNCQLVDQCSWTNLKTDDSKRPLAVHSGDGHDCQKGLSEFIDIDLKVLDDYAKQKDVKYVSMQVLSWNKIPFNKMDQCFAGIMKCDDMIKENIPSKERYKIFDPKLVTNKMDLTGGEIVCVPFIYDVEKRQMVVTDIAINQNEKLTRHQNMTPELEMKHKEKLESYAKRCNISMESVANMPTLESCNSIVANVTRNIVNNHYPNLYDLYMMAAVAGNVKPENIVLKKEDADIVFDWNGTITPYDRDVITSTFMTVEKDYEELFEKNEKKVISDKDKIENNYYYDCFVLAKANPEPIIQVENEMEK